MVRDEQILAPQQLLIRGRLGSISAVHRPIRNTRVDWSVDNNKIVIIILTNIVRGYNHVRVSE